METMQLSEKQTMVLKILAKCKKSDGLSASELSKESGGEVPARGSGMLLKKLTEYGFLKNPSPGKNSDQKKIRYAITPEGRSTFKKQK